MNKFLLNLVVFLGVIIVSYLFGSIPNGVIIGKTFFGKDPRDYFSKNSGGTNCGRVFGAKIGVLVILLDMIKVLIPVYGTWALLTFASFGNNLVWDNGYDPRQLLYWGAGLIGAFGHCFPIYIGFRGGKAVASFMGFAGFTVWGLIPFGILGFFGVFAKKKIVSISSIIGAGIIVLADWLLVILEITTNLNVNILTWTMGSQVGLKLCVEQAICLSLTYAILVIRHKENIKRLMAKTEKQLDWKK